MAVKKPCIDTIQLPKEVKDYIMGRREGNVKNGFTNKESDLLSAKELQENTLDELHNVYNKLGIEGYEKAIVKKEISETEQIEYDDLPQNVKDIVDKYGDANDKTDFNKKLEEAGYGTNYDFESFGQESGVTFFKLGKGKSTIPPTSETNKPIQENVTSSQEQSFNKQKTFSEKTQSYFNPNELKPNTGESLQESINRAEKHYGMKSPYPISIIKEALELFSGFNFSVSEFNDFVYNKISGKGNTNKTTEKDADIAKRVNNIGEFDNEIRGVKNQRRIPTEIKERYLEALRELATKKEIDLSHPSAKIYESVYDILKENEKPTTKTDKPLQSDATISQEQGNKEGVQEGVTGVGQSDANVADAVLETTTPIKDGFSNRIENLDTDKRQEDIYNLGIGDYVNVPRTDRSAGVRGFVKSIGRTNVVLDTFYQLGSTDDDGVLQEITVKKSDIKEFYKPTGQPNIKEQGKELADKIRKLRPKPGNTKSTIFAIPIAIYDTAIIGIANAVEIGTSLAQAISDAVAYIKQNVNDFDEDGFTKAINDSAEGKKPKLSVQLGIDEDLKDYADEIMSFVQKSNPNATAEDIITELEKDRGTEFDDTEATGLFDYVRSKITDNNTSGITLAATEEIRNEFALPEYEREDETFEQWDAQADIRIKNGEMPQVISKLRKGIPLTATEQRMMGKYVAELKSIAGITKADSDIAKLHDAIKLSDRIGGTENARGLVARKGLFETDDSLGGFFARDMEVAQVDVLTEEQKRQSEKEFDAITKAQEEYNKRLAELEKQETAIKAEKEIKVKKQKAKKTKKTHEDFVQERKKIIDHLKEKLKESRSQTTAVPIPYLKDLIIAAPDVSKLVTSLVEEGITKLADVVDNVHTILKDGIPDITKEDVRSLIAGDYNKKQKSKTELQAVVIDLREEARLIKKLSDLQNGVEPTSNDKKIKRNQEITKLREQIKDFEKQKQDAINEVKEAAREEERMIREFEKEQNDIEKKRLQEQVRRQKELIKELQKRTPEQIALESLQKRIETEIQKVEAQLLSGDFTTAEKRVPILENQGIRNKFPLLYKQVVELKDKLIKAKMDREIRLLQQEYKNRTTGQKIKDAILEVLNVPRTIMSSVDFSAPLRQGIIPTISHPFIAAKAFREMFQQAFSQKRFDRWFHNLRQDPDFKIMEQSGLYVADPHDYKLSAKEEMFMNNLAEKIPLIGKIIKGSERAYVSYLNKMRVDLFKQGEAVLVSRGMTFENSPKEYKALGSWTNNATGRGGMITALENAAPILNTVFFSPRLIASRLNLLNPVYYYRLPANIRKMALGDMAKFATFGLSVLASVYIAGNDEEDEKNGITIETDVRSSDFGKIKSGNTRYDIWGGFQQYIRFLGQIFSGETKSQSGKIRKLDGEGIFGQDRGDVIARFFRGKLAPVPATTVDIFTRRTIMGDKINLNFSNPFVDNGLPDKQMDLSDEAKKILMPLVLSDVREAFEKEGAKSLYTTWLPATFGIGVQTYESKNKK